MGIKLLQRWKALLKMKLLSAMMFTLLAGSALAGQGKTVTGKVTDENGEPVPGVNIVIRGTVSGTITDMDGNYSINVNAGAVLMFSYIGYVVEEIPVDNRSVVNVALVPNLQELQEVVVIGYGEQKKVTVTGAINSISSEELMKSPTSSVGNSLAGKVTGLASIQYSGQPGADDPSLFIRGISTLNDASPLMLVDGVERSFMQLDPTEIESVSVLKDASATAVYGVRGANGVIIVTTKRGTKGPAKINVNLSSGLQQPTRLLEFADSYTYALRFNETQLNDGVDPENLRFSEEVVEAFRTGSNPIIFPSVDWVDYVIKPAAFQTQNSISINGGTDKVKYFVSTGYLKQDGLFRSFDLDYNNNFTYDRYNIRTNLDVDVTSTTKLSLTSGGRVEVRNEPNTVGNAEEMWHWLYNSVPFSGPGIVDGKYVTLDTRYIDEEKKDGLQQTYGRGHRNGVKNVLNIDLGLDQKLDFIAKGLKFRAKAAYNTSYTHTKMRYSSKASYTPYFRKDVDPSAPDDNTIVFKKSGADGILGYDEGYGKARDWYMEGGLSYTGDFGPHSITGLLLYNQSKAFYPKTYTDIPTGYVGLVGRVTYDYKTKYMLDLNLGYNGSENFATATRFGFFPAVSAGWILTEESFMKNNSVIDYLKLRASYGMVGNDKQGGNRFIYLPDRYYTSQGGYNFGVDVPQNQTAAAEGMIGNPLAQWEVAAKQNYGVDMKVMNGMLGISFDYFYEYRDNILKLRETVPAFVAVDLPPVNIGEVENRGFEVELKWKQDIGDFKYWINANTSFARNRILFQDEVRPNEPYLARTGHSVGQPFGYIFDGFYTAADTAADANVPDQQFDAKPGDVKYKDLNNDGVIDTDDQMAIGHTEYPEVTFGGRIGFEYKNFDVTSFWAGAANTSRMLSATYREAFGATQNRSLMQWAADNRWTPENVNAEYPRLTFANRINNNRDSDLWMRDASYLRLKNLEIGYNAKPGFLEKYGIKNLRVYANGYNLLTFDKLKISDPEQKTDNRPDYPLIRIYNVGVNLNF